MALGHAPDRGCSRSGLLPCRRANFLSTQEQGTMPAAAFYTTADILQAHPALTWDGYQWTGPCPSCGGQDRFHLAAAAGHERAVFGCRGCLDEQPALEKKNSVQGYFSSSIPVAVGVHGNLYTIPS